MIDQQRDECSDNSGARTRLSARKKDDSQRASGPAVISQSKSERQAHRKAAHVRQHDTTILRSELKPEWQFLDRSNDGCASRDFFVRRRERAGRTRLERKREKDGFNDGDGGDDEEGPS